MILTTVGHQCPQDAFVAEAAMTRFQSYQEGHSTRKMAILSLTTRAWLAAGTLAWGIKFG